MRSEPNAMDNAAELLSRMIDDEQVISRKRLADLTGRDKSTISRYLNGEATVPVFVLRAAFAATRDMRLLQLVGGEVPIRPVILLACEVSPGQPVGQRIPPLDQCMPQTLAAIKAAAASAEHLSAIVADGKFDSRDLAEAAEFKTRRHRGDRGPGPVHRRHRGPRTEVAGMTAIPPIARPLDPSTPSRHPAGTEIRQRQGEAHDPPASPARTVASPCLRGGPADSQQLTADSSSSSHGASPAAGVLPPFSSGAADEAGGGAGRGDGSPDSTCGMDCSRAARLLWRERLDAAMVDTLDSIARMRELLAVPGMPVPHALLDEVIRRGQQELLAARAIVTHMNGRRFPPVVLGRLDQVPVSAEG